MTPRLAAFAFAVIGLIPGWAPATPLPEVCADCFRYAVQARGDATEARRVFGLAAQGYDHVWHTEPHTPAIALNRGRSHFLAGQLPQAIRAFRDGLELYPWDAELQQGLLACRAAVAYPTEADPAVRVRPDPPNSLRHRVSPWDLLVAATAFSLLLTVGLAHRLTARDGWSVPVAVVGLVGLLVVAAAAWAIDAEVRADRANPVVVVTADTALRTGDGTAFPARLDSPLPRGAEVRELARRGGWVQVELPGGAAGWIPEAVILGEEN